MKKEYEKYQKEECKKALKKQSKEFDANYDKFMKKELKNAMKDFFKMQVKIYMEARNELDKIIAGGEGYISFSGIIRLIVSDKKVENVDSATKEMIKEKNKLYMKMLEKQCFDLESITKAIKDVVTDYNSIISFERIATEEYDFFKKK